VNRRRGRRHRQRCCHCHELGCHGILMNTAVAAAKNPILMPKPCAKPSAGTQGIFGGPYAQRLYANASSPEAGLIE